MKADQKELALGLVLKHGEEDALRIANQSLEASKRSDSTENVSFYENVIIYINKLKTAKYKGEK